MPTRKIVEYMFFAALSTLGTIGVSYVKQISRTLNELSTSVTMLNGRLELMTERWAEVNHMVKDHEGRLRQVERN